MFPGPAAQRGLIAVRVLLQGAKPVSKINDHTERLVKSGGARQMMKDFSSVKMDYVSKFKLSNGVSIRVFCLGLSLTPQSTFFCHVEMLPKLSWVVLVVYRVNLSCMFRAQSHSNQSPTESLIGQADPCKNVNGRTHGRTSARVPPYKLTMSRRLR